MLERNWQAAGAEIDLIVGRGGLVRFVEVKARPDESAWDAVTTDKQRRLRRAAEAWLAHHDVDECAFMVAWVKAGEDGSLGLELLDDAF